MTPEQKARVTGIPADWIKPKHVYIKPWNGPYETRPHDWESKQLDEMLARGEIRNRHTG